MKGRRWMKGRNVGERGATENSISFFSVADVNPSATLKWLSNKKNTNSPENNELHGDSGNNLDTKRSILP